MHLDIPLQQSNAMPESSMCLLSHNHLSKLFYLNTDHKLFLISQNYTEEWCSWRHVAPNHTKWSSGVIRRNRWQLRWPVLVERIWELQTTIHNSELWSQNHLPTVPVNAAVMMVKLELASQQVAKKCLRRISGYTKNYWTGACLTWCWHVSHTLHSKSPNLRLSQGTLLTNSAKELSYYGNFLNPSHSEDGTVNIERANCRCPAAETQSCMQTGHCSEVFWGS